ncbi:MAG TPA: hypothetical protein VFZ25_18215 [Chloroflexota bacterium]|nr:hypothetical protein [Chloroflexota bacterium]
MNLNRRYLLGLAAVLAIGVGLALFRASSGDAPAPLTSPTATAVPRATLAVASAPVKQGGAAQFSGSNFAPGEAVVITASSLPASAPSTDASNAANGKATPTPAATTTVTLARANAAADGTVKVNLPNLPDTLTSGHYRLTAVGQKSGRQATATLPVQAKALWITPSTYAAKQRGQLGFALGGFAPGETVAVALEPADHQPNGQSQNPGKLSKTTSVTTVKADDVGNASWTQVEIPEVLPGAYNLVATGAKSGQNLKINIVVEALTPVVTLSPWSGPPGSKVQVNARGFGPQDDVQIFLGDAQKPVATASADQYGNFWGVGPLQIPYGNNSGPLKIRVVDPAAGSDVSATFNVQSTAPWLQLNAYSGPPGTPVSFSGGGWAADETVKIHLGDAGGPVVAVSQADDYGWLRPGSGAAVPAPTPSASEQLSTAPTVSTSTVTFTAVGDHSRASATASFKAVAVGIG